MDTALSSAPDLPESLREFLAAPPRPAGAIAKVRYTHDAMIDQIVANPWISQNQLADHFGYTPGWVSQVISSDAFQARLAERKEELVDPTIRATIEEQFKALVHQSLSVLRRKLEGNPSDDLVLGAVNVASKALGFGARTGQVINQQFVVQVPGKIPTSAEWVEKNTPGVAPHLSSVGGQEVAQGTVDIRRGVAGNVTDAEIISTAPARAPAPTRPDAERLLSELVSG